MQTTAATLPATSKAPPATAGATHDFDFFRLGIGGVEAGVAAVSAEKSNSEGWAASVASAGLSAGWSFSRRRRS